MAYDQDTVTDKEIAEGAIPASPRIRQSRSASLTLTTSWQRLQFTGVNAANGSTFPMNEAGTMRMVEYDATNHIFKLNSTVDRNYTISLFLKTTASSLLNAVNLTMASLQIRFVVPNGNGAGVPYYYPFPGEDECLDLNLVNSVSPWRQEYYSTLFADERKRVNGVGVDIRLSNAIAGTITLNSANVLIYGR